MNEENNNLSNGTNSGINTVKTLLVIIVIILLIALLSFTLYDKVINKNNANNNQTNVGDNNESTPTLTMTDDEIYRKNNNVSANDDFYGSTLTYIISDSEKALLQNLVFPFEGINGDIESSFKAELFNFNIDNLSASKKISLISVLVDDDDFNYVDGSDSNELESCKGCYEDEYGRISNIYVTESKMKKLYSKIYGPDEEYVGSNVTETVDGLSCGSVSNYDSENKNYWYLSGCGGDIVESNVILVNKVEKSNDEINVYVQAGRYDVIRNSEEDVKYSIYKYRDNSNILWTGKKEDINSNVLDLAKQNKLDSYKFTFKKQSDGKYYIYSGEWQ